MSLWLLAGVVALFNLPFGYWRANVRRLSVPWFLAIHLPVLFVILARIFGSIGWELTTFPVLVGAYALGQFLGDRLLVQRRTRFGAAVSSCLVMDTVRHAAALLMALH